jgi:ABC-type multidrug transport system permease subunit
MDTLIQILGYGFVAVVVAGLFYIFTKLLVGALGALTKDDD